MQWWARATLPGTPCAVTLHSTAPLKRSGCGAEPKPPHSSSPPIWAANSDVTLKPVASPDEAVQGASIVYCTTRSQDAVVQNEWVSPGTHLNAFGSDAPGKRELDPAILGRAKVVVDSLEQCKIGGEVSTPIAQGKMSEDDVYAELGEIVNGWKKGRESEDEVTVMDSTGLAALDVVAFNHAYEKALAQGVGIELEL